MNESEALNAVNKIFQAVFATDNHLSIAEIKQKFAFDLDLPNKVQDFITSEDAWAATTNADTYITQKNMEEYDSAHDWMQPKQDFGTIADIITAWEKINHLTTDRLSDSINVKYSDPIYRSENVYCSTNCNDSKFLVFCNSCGSNNEYLLASARSGHCNFCIRTDDSINCSNSFSVIYSNKVINSLFIQDCFDLYECMFCSHIACKKFCIANMQFSEQEYFVIKPQIIQWILQQ